MAAAVVRSDLDIHAQIVAELDWDERFHPGEIGVEVDDGVVTLRGTVSSYAKLRGATDLVSRIAGVRAVVDRLVVRAPLTQDDVLLATRARMAMEMDADASNERIECIVRGGTLTLRGTVDHAYQKKAAEDAVANLEGLQDLESEIEIRGHTRSDGDVERDLREALRRRVPFADRVTCSIANGTVSLSGRVPMLADRLAAEETAWRTRGVRHVVDHIVVSAYGEGA